MQKKLLYVGTMAKQPDRDTGWVRSFEALGWTVQSISSLPNFSSNNLINKVKRRLSLGSEYRNIEKLIIKIINEFNPDWIHFRLPVQFGWKFIKNLRDKYGLYVTCYFNDDPLSKNRVKFHYHKFLRSIPYYNVHYVYRKKNIDEFYSCGAKYVYHCGPTYDVSRHKFEGVCKNFSSDVAFIGHYENDWRADCITAILNSGYRVVLRGGMWDKVYNKFKSHFDTPITGAYGDEYNFIYGNSMLGLCFFSKINNDQWTERALEIIAVGGVLLCERTNEAMSYFIEGKEAFYFSSTDELLSVIKTVKNDNKLRNDVMKAAQIKLNLLKSSIAERAEMISDDALRYMNGDLHA
jgi:spore maturation protein CgeB